MNKWLTKCRIISIELVSNTPLEWSDFELRKYLTICSAYIYCMISFAFKCFTSYGCLATYSLRLMIFTTLSSFHIPETRPHVRSLFYLTWGQISTGFKLDHRPKHDLKNIPKSRFYSRVNDERKFDGRNNGSGMYRLRANLHCNKVVPEAKPLCYRMTNVWFFPTQFEAL